VVHVAEWGLSGGLSRAGAGCGLGGAPLLGAPHWPSSAQEAVPAQLGAPPPPAVRPAVFEGLRNAKGGAPDPLTRDLTPEQKKRRCACCSASFVSVLPFFLFSCLHCIALLRLLVLLPCCCFCFCACAYACAWGTVWMASRLTRQWLAGWRALLGGSQILTLPACFMLPPCPPSLLPCWLLPPPLLACSVILKKSNHDNPGIRKNIHK
jgi:hypothetical protein